MPLDRLHAILGADGLCEANCGGSQRNDVTLRWIGLMESVVLERAPRFAIPISMLYREVGSLQWLRGQTENISRSGVLFRAKEPIDPDRSIELLIRIPLEVAGDDAGLSWCVARAVRTIAPDISGAQPAVAAAIVDCERLLDDPRRI